MGTPLAFAAILAGEPLMVIGLSDVNCPRGEPGGMAPGGRAGSVYCGACPG